VRAFPEAQDGVVYCRMTKAAAKLQPGLVRLAHALGAYVSPNGGANELYQDIRGTLELRSSLLLILDEAQHMDDELLETVRDLYDESNDAQRDRQMGLVLVGNYGLTDRWTDRSAKRRKFSNFKQLRGRLGPMLDFGAPTAEDVSALCGHHGITGRQACGMIAKVATAPGGLHNVANLLRVAVQLAGPGGAISPRHLDEAALVTGVRS
jgi:DNA transposition AAA+ family ATPase